MRSIRLYCCGVHRHLHSFPTRRSSDLAVRVGEVDMEGVGARRVRLADKAVRGVRGTVDHESEAELTSELQSRVRVGYRLQLGNSRAAVLDKRSSTGRHLAAHPGRSRNG